MNLTLSLLVPLLAGQPGPPAGGCGPAGVCPPSGPPAPVLTTRLIAPPGVRVVAYPGGPPRPFPAPAAFGLRPGYVYRFALSELPDHPGETIYPTVEVRGSLVPRPTLRPESYPTPVVVSRADIDKVLAGVMVTKVIYLEDPTRAIPVRTRPDEPLEISHETEDAAYRAARDNGRVVAIVRIGHRSPDDTDLAHAVVGGTMLCPGDTHLAAPGCPPVVPCSPVQFYDPLTGPRVPAEECLVDGGDKGPRLGVRPDGGLGGLDATDVAAEFSQLGKRRVVTSNEVCICVPRFVARRADLGLARIDITAGPDRVTQSTGRSQYTNRTPAQAVFARQYTLGVAGSVRPAGEVGFTGLAGAAGRTRPSATATVQGVLTVGAVVELDELSLAGPFTISKTVDPPGPHQIGDEVTITLRYRNNTQQPAADVVVSDSLSGRLEYVPGSAASDRAANVTTPPNEAGSVVVRFDLPGSVPQGQGGEVRFRARIR